MVSRRNFLKGAGGVAVGLPFLPSLSGRARANCTDGVKRLIVLHQPQGMIMEEWRPSSFGSNFELSPILAPLAPHQQDIVIVSGLDNPMPEMTANQSGHNGSNKSILTGMPLSTNMTKDGAFDPLTTLEVEYDPAGGPSVDQVIAQRMAAPTAYESLGLGIGGGGDLVTDGAFYESRGDWLGMDADPRAVFDRLFSDLEAPPEPTAAQRLRAGRGSVLDSVASQYSSVASRASAADRIALDAHAERIRDLERRLGNGGGAGAGCSQPQYSFPANYDPDHSDFDDVGGRAQIDNAVMALACDLTRVASLQFSDASPSFAFLDHGITFSDYGWDGYHGAFHIEPEDSGVPSGRDIPEVRAMMLQAMTWYAEMFAYLVGRLAETPDGDGSLLDSTLVLWTSEFGDGRSHWALDMPIVMAGGACGAIETGRCLDYSGRSTNDLLVSVLNAFGHEDQSFGWADNCNGPLPGLVS